MTTENAKSIHEFTVKDAKGADVNLSQYQGKVLLIVNVASKCGFTPQYTGLEALSKKYSAQGLGVIGFPCNQFGAQEPGDEAEIQNFCKLTYDVDFPIMKKIEVNGKNSEPVYEYLKSSAPGILGTEAIKWNFTKFLIDKKGKVAGRFAPNVKPEELTKEIESLLAQ
jgi:glutathione peroxidase